MDTLSLILMIIGAINWGLVGIFQFDLVAAICGSSASVVARWSVLRAYGALRCCAGATGASMTGSRAPR